MDINEILYNVLVRANISYPDELEKDKYFLEAKSQVEALIQTASEIFVPLKDYEGKYEVSNTGKIRSVKYKNRTGRELVVQPGNGKWAYKFIHILDKENKSHTELLHRLIAKTFVSNPHNYPDVNHIDGDRNNNHANNLEWCTHEQNMHHAIREGRYTSYGENNKQSKLTETQAREILALKGKFTGKEVAEKYGVHPTNVSMIWRRKSWMHLDGNGKVDMLLKSKQKGVE